PSAFLTLPSAANKPRRNAAFTGRGDRITASGIVGLRSPFSSSQRTSHREEIATTPVPPLDLYSLKGGRYRNRRSNTSCAHDDSCGVTHTRTPSSWMSPSPHTNPSHSANAGVTVTGKSHPSIAHGHSGRQPNAFFSPISATPCPSTTTGSRRIWTTSPTFSPPK